jgi:hypothetical protein
MTLLDFTMAAETIHVNQNARSTTMAAPGGRDIQQL